MSARNMLNEAHLTGLVLCRTFALKKCVIEGNPIDLLGHEAVVLTDYRDMSMRLLHDSVEHSQMHLQTFLDVENFHKFEEHLQRLFARLGQLLLPLDLPDAIFDDTDSLDVGVDGITSKIMSNSTVRWYMDVFVILFRHIELHRITETPVPVRPRVELQNFHIEASRDDFYKHSQYFDLPPAAALCYASDFGDLLNNVSQIIYFCYPEYKRRNLIEDHMVSSGDFPIYTLAAALSMFPAISVIHEDDVFGAAPGVVTASATVHHKKAGWRIVLALGTILLLSDKGEVFKHQNMLELLRVVPSE